MNPLDQLTDWPVPNCSAAVIGRAGTLATFGDQRQRYPLASVTKPLAALATLVAVEEEAVTLDQPLTDLAIAEELPGATLRHLLAHASGIAADRRERAAAPGTRRIYSNAGFDVIGELVGTATGLSFADYLHEAVAVPLRMHDTRLDGSPAKDAVSTVADLSLVLVELLSPSGLLHSSTLQAATTVQFPGLRGVLPGYGLQADNDWGLGFEIRADKSPHWTSSRNSAASYGHFGRSGTMFWIDPKAQVALVALADRDFDEWSIKAWPLLSDAVLDAFG
jgi:CubicO group peptidase (beta-lactamase class C family)